nr:hypothetical protein [Mucilaginibacter sp. X4EP1]
MGQFQLINYPNGIWGERVILTGKGAIIFCLNNAASCHRFYNESWNNNLRQNYKRYWHEHLRRAKIARGIQPLHLK